MSQSQKRIGKNLATTTIKKVPIGGRVALGLTSIVTLGAIYYSHSSQVWDQERMKEGVERDKERLRMKRRMKKRNKIREDNEAGGGDTGR